mmetsp:Transcript_1534/g.3655  ORF Transcript_1534/g.3655 Transcript_1534/m.3655 type:complete len:325 (+) Transcript_1534:646-1620(+)
MGSDHVSNVLIAPLALAWPNIPTLRGHNHRGGPSSLHKGLGHCGNLRKLVSRRLWLNQDPVCSGLLLLTSFGCGRCGGDCGPLLIPKGLPGLPVLFRDVAMGEAAEGDGGVFTVEVRNVNLLILLGIEDGEDLSIRIKSHPIRLNSTGSAGDAANIRMRAIVAANVGALDLAVFPWRCICETDASFRCRSIGLVRLPSLAGLFGVALDLLVLLPLGLDLLGVLVFHVLGDHGPGQDRMTTRVLEGFDLAAVQAVAILGVFAFLVLGLLDAVLVQRAFGAGQASGILVAPDGTTGPVVLRSVGTQLFALASGHDGGGGTGSLRRL